MPTTSAWSAQVARYIAEDQRQPQAVSGGFLLHGGDLHARFDPWGLEVAGWRFDYDGTAAEPQVDGVRVTYQRDGGVTEWYEARPDGIEQGFDVEQLPAAGDLVVRGRVESSEPARMLDDGLAFGDLRYTGLAAWDAAGRPLRGAIEWEPETNRIALRVPAEALVGAEPPVTLDPLLSTASWTADPTDQAGAEFGRTVAGAGDVNGDGYADVIVGAYSWDGGAMGEGRAYLFLGGATGLASSAAWTADPTDQANAWFGLSVAGVGDVNADGFADVVVGARWWNGTAVDEGRAYLYLGGATGLAAGPSWTADPTDQASAYFGYSVAGAGDVNRDGFADVLVGARNWDSAVTNEGRAYLYLGGASGLAASAAWTADPTDQASAFFGGTVAGAGDVNGDGFADVVVGAELWDGAVADEGRAYLFLGGASGLSASSAWTADPTNQTTARFSQSIAGAGDVNGDGLADVVVGALEWDGAAANEGRAYLYLGTASGLTSVAAWTADPTDQSGADFGVSVANAGDTNGDGYADVIIGAFGWDGVAANEGRAYLYLGGPTALAASPAWTADPTDLVGAFFGFVAGAGDVNGDGFADVVIGASGWDGAATDEGRAYVFLGYAGGLTQSPTWTGEPADQAGAAFGASAASAGDVNGDGFGDVIVGAPYWDGAAVDEGRAIVYCGGSTGLTAVPCWSAEPTDQATARFGSSVSGVGDVNGDGFADVIVGAYAWDGSAANEGRGYVYLGSATGLGASPAWTADPADQADAGFGYAAAAAGDVNGDGYADAILGAAWWDGAALDEGRAYLFLGSAAGLAATPAWTGDPADQASAYFARAVAGAGDVNGDGFGDVLCTAYAWDGEAVNEGKAYLYLGSATGLAASPAWTSDPTDQASAMFGTSVGSAGDVNADGHADVLVGAFAWDGEAVNEGRTYLYLGSAAGLAATSGWTADPTDQVDAEFGVSAAAAGDVNGDGYSDAIIGAFGWDGEATDEGRAYVYLGGADGLAAAPTRLVDPTDQASAWFGTWVSGAGDVNGDGFSDVIVGAPAWDGTAADEGGAYLFVGGDGARGLVRVLGQFREDGTTRIGVGNSAGGMTVVLKGRVTQEGWAGGRLRLEFEVKPSGTPFDGTNTVLSSPVNPGQSASATVASLAAGAYRWRARVVYPVETGWGRWVQFGANGEADADFRVPALADGASCTSAWQCASGACVDSVCCNGPCGGGAGNDCQACSVAAGAAVNGVCAAIADATACGDGVCDQCAAGACVPSAAAAAGPGCTADPTSCSAADTCDGAGGCAANDLAAGADCADATPGDCTDARCDGTGVCNQLYGAESAGTICRAAADGCDLAEACDGSPGVCPADAKQPSGTACGDGVCEQCNGTGACLPSPVGTSGPGCNATASECSAADVCNGAGACNAGDFAAGTLCVDVTPGDCDEARCDGAGGCSQSFIAEAPGYLCRAGGGLCDPSEACSGAPGACPANVFAPGGAACGDGVCDQCDGSGSCVATPAGAAGPGCSSLATECSGADACDGSGLCGLNHLPTGVACTDTTPGDCADARCDSGGVCNQMGALEAATLVCRPAAGVCDAAETCNGTSTACPADGPLPNGTPCGDGVCDLCAGGGCVPSAAGAPGPGCDAADSECSAADTCDGMGACAANDLAGGTSCADATPGDCDDARCDGAGSCDPDWTAEAVGTVCRASSGECDPEETCGGAPGACPADVHVPAGVACGDEVCDACDGAGGCAPTAAGAAGPGCAAPATECSAADTCDGAGLCAPSDSPAGTACTDATPTDCGDARCDGGGVCDQDGAMEEEGYVCRGAAGGCDLAETCTAATTACPPDDDGDADSDLVCTPVDNCPTLANPAQTDTDGDGSGDACDGDDDGDGLDDTDEEALGTDVLAGDSDGDTIGDADEVGPDPAAPRDTDGDAVIDALDLDSDGDGIDDEAEAGDGLVETPPVDTDGDVDPDARDLDSDDDGVGDAIDNCRLAANPGQEDGDADGAGDACDPIVPADAGTPDAGTAAIDAGPDAQATGPDGAYADADAGSGPDGDSGCGCRTGGGGRTRWLASALLMAVLLITAARRRPRPRPACRR